MVPVELVLVVCHISWFGVCTNELFFVLTSNVNVNVMDGQLYWARRQKVNVAVKDCIPVIVKSPSKLVDVAIELGWEIQLSIFRSSILMTFDVPVVGW